MTITTRDQLIDALGNNSSRLVIDKANIANALAGAYFSLWRATGQPGQGAIPTAAATCNNALTGAMNFTQQTAPATSYGAWSNAVCSNSAVTIEVHDRLMQMGGLVGNVTTAQTVSLNLNGVTADNMVERRGDANFSDVQWWAEWYTDTGATASNATVAVTYNDGTTGNLSTFAAGGTVRAGRMIPLNNLIPAAAAGKFIRSVDSVTLSAATGTAGNIGFTCTRPRMTMPLPLANKMEVFDWAQLGLPEIFNSSCLSLIELCSTTSTGAVRGGGKIIHG
jgi:hypothetical protein